MGWGEAEFRKEMKTYKFPSQNESQNEVSSTLDYGKVVKNRGKNLEGGDIHGGGDLKKKPTKCRCKISLCTKFHSNWQGWQKPRLKKIKTKNHVLKKIKNNKPLFYFV